MALISGNSLDNLLIGSSTDDLIYGNAGDDTLVGFGGDDTLYGGTGADRLDGYSTAGIEYDTLYGGTGSDTFVLGGSWGVSYQGLGYATIADWNPAADYIEITGATSLYSMRFDLDWGGSSARDTTLYYGNDVVAVVQDTTNVSFSRDFIVV